MSNEESLAANVARFLQFKSVWGRGETFSRIVVNYIYVHFEILDFGKKFAKTRALCASTIPKQFKFRHSYSKREDYICPARE